MKIILGFILGTVVLTGSQAQETGSPAVPAPTQAATSEGAGTLAPGATKSAPASSRVLVRGWEVQSALAIKRATISRSLPEYRQRKRVGSLTTEEAAKKGEFLVVLVQSRWATPQAPNDVLWTGKPDVTLVNDLGAEYPAVDILGWQAGSYVGRGMGSKARRGQAKQTVARTSQALMYFDVPNSSGRTFSLRFAGVGASLPVTRVLDLPQLDNLKLD